ncbi:MAG: toxin-antitoxin system YwqK family antitoxin [Halothermotrichaceae bacterium]
MLLLGKIKARVKITKERIKDNRVKVILLLVFQMCINYYIIFGCYHTGKLFSTIPIIYFNILYLIFIWGVLKLVSGDRLKPLVVVVFIIAFIGNMATFVDYSSSVTVSVNTYLYFNQRKVTIDCDDNYPSTFPLYPPRTIDIFSQENDPNVIITRGSEEKLVNKNGIYYEKGNFAPFSGVYIQLDKEGKSVKKGVEFKLGRKQEYREYSDDKITKGSFIDYESDGVVTYEISYHEEYNRKTGVETQKYYRNEKLSSVWKYKSGSVDAFYHAEYDQGTIRREKIYEEQIKLYYPDGSLAFTGGLSDQFLRGNVKFYYENGQLKYKGYVTEVDIPSIGDLNDVYFDDSYKSPLILAEDVNNNVENIEGDIAVTAELSAVVDDNGWYLDRTGLTPIMDYKECRHGDWEYYYENGQLKAKGKYSYGCHSGLWKFYHENGQIAAVGNYSRYGVEQGEWSYYYDNGQLKSRGLYEHAQTPEWNRNRDSVIGIKTIRKKPIKIGEWSYYSKEGKLMAKGNYRNGKKVGKWLERDKESNKLQESVKQEK